MTDNADDGPIVCRKCGVVHAEKLDSGQWRCQRHCKDGTQCGRRATGGLDACSQHTGYSLALARVVGQNRLARERALGEVGHLIDSAMQIVGSQTGPEQLQTAIDRAGAMAMSYQMLIAEMSDTATWSMTENQTVSGSVQRLVDVTTPGLLMPNDKGVMHLHPFEEALRYWTRLHGELLRTAAAIGLEDRRQALIAEQTQTIASVVRMIVAGLGRDLADPEVAPVVHQALILASGGVE